MLQKELASIFQAQTRMMPGVLVSVTRVRISPDLSICTANLSVFPSERGEEIIKNIQANEKQIRYELGTRVRNQLRIIPELRFFIDDSLDYLEKIDELLKKYFMYHLPSTIYNFHTAPVKLYIVHGKW